MGRESEKEWVYVYVYVQLNHLAVQLKLNQPCKQTIYPNINFKIKKEKADKYLIFPLFSNFQ